METSPSFRIAHIARALSRSGAHFGRDQVLNEISKCPGLTQTELARRCGISLPVMSRALRRMDDADLIDRDVYDIPSAWRVSLMQKGEAELRNARANWRILDTRFLTDLDPGERALLTDFLRRIHP